MDDRDRRERDRLESMRLAEEGHRRAGTLNVVSRVVPADEVGLVECFCGQARIWPRQSAGAICFGCPTKFLGQPAKIKAGFTGIIKAVLLDPARGGQPITVAGYSHPSVLPRYAEEMFTDDEDQVIYEPVLFVAGEDGAGGWFEVSALLLRP